MRRPFLPVSVIALILVSCAAGSEPGSQISPPPHSGVRGTVTYGPLCPVEQAGSPCPDRPWRGDVQGRLLDGTLVSQVSTDPDGSFVLPLNPGTYDVMVATPEDGMPNAKAQRVTVTAGGFVTITMQVDSGIR
jgi:hypothetical protein